ncbi:hypothetical protein F4821DRAFT_263947 [Hypoxylon rubiginosum]|uniref:Uncharacterized protein n=1 Tax=Hypoxylon rubiginosum TaxID=110542 RepID=A0ACC0CPX4_9PEZI|nr:hypothetical protein F4821DRAFT_263947 [Hypoxylon rubiginosum]
MLRASTSSISNDTRTTSDGMVVENKSDHSDPHDGISRGGKAPRRRPLEAALSDRYPKRRKMAGITRFESGLPSRIIKAVIDNGKIAIDQAKEEAMYNFLRAVNENVEVIYETTLTEFEEERNGCVLEMKSTMSEGQMPVWLQDSEFRDQDMATMIDTSLDIRGLMDEWMLGQERALEEIYGKLIASLSSEAKELV